LHRYALIRVGDFEVAKGGGVWVAIGVRAEVWPASCANRA
jgi:hypothetical protein